MVMKKVAAGIATTGLAFGGGVALEIVLLPHPAVAMAAQATKSVFTGSYDDPNHPGCMREISVEGKKVRHQQSCRHMSIWM